MDFANCLVRNVIAASQISLEKEFRTFKKLIQLNDWRSLHNMCLDLLYQSTEKRWYLISGTNIFHVFFLSLSHVHPSLNIKCSFLPYSNCSIRCLETEIVILKPPSILTPSSFPPPNKRKMYQFLCQKQSNQNKFSCQSTLLEILNVFMHATLTLVI